MQRYENMFARLRDAGEAALIPFFVLGFPDEERCLQLIDAALAAGADALELGIAYSDPVADGPVIVAAVNQALAAGSTPARALAMVLRVRRKHPQIPIGLLLYSNLVLAQGYEAFCRQAKAAGVDSVLLADLPLREASDLRAAARAKDLQIVFILPPNADATRTEAIAAASQGYVYLLSRAGVTGAGQQAGMPLQSQLQHLRDLRAAPAILGFGISQATQVQAAVRAGVAGVIVGSALVHLIQESGAEAGSVVQRFIKELKAATGAEPLTV